LRKAGSIFAENFGTIG